MVGGTVFTYQSATIDAQYHVEALYGYVVDDVVVGTLQKR